jgi:hypothetical protein
MILVADFYRGSNEHVPVNAGLLYIISRQYIHQEVHFYAERSHLNLVKAYVKDNGLSLDNVYWQVSQKQVNVSGRFFLIKRILNELLSFRKLYGQLKKPLIENVFLLSLSPITSLFFNFFLFRRSNVLITLHGDLEFIKMSSNSGRNILGACYRVSFRIKRERCRYLVLDEVIRKNLLAGGFLAPDQVIAVPHPYVYRMDGGMEKAYAPEKLTFGHIGLASLAKQSHFFYDLANIFKQQIVDGKMSFIVIGKNEDVPPAYLNDLVKGGSGDMLDRKSYENLIEEIDYSVFYYTNDNYKFGSSGAVQDAFDFEKPILALRNDLFESIFERAGMVGFLFDKPEEVAEFIRAIPSGIITDDDYLMMKGNMRIFKKDHSLNNIGSILFSKF